MFPYVLIENVHHGGDGVLCGLRQSVPSEQNTGSEKSKKQRHPRADYVRHFREASALEHETGALRVGIIETESRNQIQFRVWEA